MNNRKHNCTNPYQGRYKRVLCVCSAGLLRSPTAANVLHKEFGYNTRAAGIIEDYALIPVDEVLIEWAEEIVCMEFYQEELLRVLTKKHNPDVKIICLEVPDTYPYMDDDLKTTIVAAYREMSVDI